MKTHTDVMTSVPLFAARVEQAGAFEVQRLDEGRTRLVMREPHFANNVRYVLEVHRREGRLAARWSDPEDESLRPWLEVGLA